ncbi:MAG: transposase, partial [Pyrinomonadaceae bacterium]
SLFTAQFGSSSGQRIGTDFSGFPGICVCGWLKHSGNGRHCWLKGEVGTRQRRDWQTPVVARARRFRGREILLLRKRAIIETVNDLLKNISQIEYSRHRSLWNFLGNVASGLIAYSFREKKPSLNLDKNWQLEPISI